MYLSEEYIMAYLIIDDENPESDDYENNYIYFDENDPDSLSKALELLRKNKKWRHKRDSTPLKDSDEKKDDE